MNLLEIKNYASFQGEMIATQSEYVDIFQESFFQEPLGQLFVIKFGTQR